jgi:hypothetical protein
VKAFPKSSSRKKKKESIYSKGEINKLIDSLLHPLSDRYPTLTIFDSILHGLVEQNPPETILKFVRYNLPKIIEEIIRE